MNDAAGEERLTQLLKSLDRRHQDLSDAMALGEAVAVIQRRKAELIGVAREIDHVVGMRQKPFTR